MTQVRQMSGAIGAAAMMCVWVTGAQAGDPVPLTHGPTTRQVIAVETGYPKGTILISNAQRTLDIVLSHDTVARYTIGVARAGFTWTGTVRVGRKAEWPTWRPPQEMLERDPSLPRVLPGGPYNPLGARALYLYADGRDTLYRIHGTNSVGSVGTFSSSGCFRMTNADVLELYDKVAIGTKVVVQE